MFMFINVNSDNNNFSVYCHNYYFQQMDIPLQTNGYGVLLCMVSYMHLVIIVPKYLLFLKGCQMFRSRKKINILTSKT